MQPHVAAIPRPRPRSPLLAAAHARVATPEPHPLFRIVPGPVALWERAG